MKRLLVTDWDEEVVYELAVRDVPEVGYGAEVTEDEIEETGRGSLAGFLVETGPVVEIVGGGGQTSYKYVVKDGRAKAVESFGCSSAEELALALEVQGYFLDDPEDDAPSGNGDLRKELARLKAENRRLSLALEKAKDAPSAVFTEDRRRGRKAGK